MAVRDRAVAGGRLAPRLLDELALLSPRSPVARGEFHAELEDARRRQWDAARLEEVRRLRLERVLREALEAVPYWLDQAETLRAALSSLEAGASAEEALRRLAVLDKSTLRRRYTQLLSRRAGPVTLSYTSGTRGWTAVVARSKAAVRLSLAAFERLAEAAGLPATPRLVSVLAWSWRPRRMRFRGGRRVTWIELGLPELLERRRLRGDAAIASPAVLQALAEADPDLRHRFDALISSYERLDPHRRDLVEGLTGLPVFDLYSGAEIATPVAFQCAERDGLHVNEDYVVVEVLDEAGREAPPGTQGAIVVTDLLNLAMPLVRYRVGDVGRLAASSCSCGRALRLLASVDGRLGDAVALRDGGRAPAVDALDALARELRGEFQLVQEEAGRFELLVSAPADAAAVRCVLAESLGEPAEVEVMTAPDTFAARPGRKVPRFVSRVSRRVHELGLAGPPTAEDARDPAELP